MSWGHANTGRQGGVRPSQEPQQGEVLGTCERGGLVARAQEPLPGDVLGGTEHRQGPWVHDHDHGGAFVLPAVVGTRQR